VLRNKDLEVIRGLPMRLQKPNITLVGPMDNRRVC